MPEEKLKEENLKEKIKQDLKKASKKTGSLTARKYELLGNHSLYRVRKHFETWNKAKEEAGLETYEGHSTKRSSADIKKIKEDIKKVKEETDGYLTLGKYKEKGECISKIRSRFKSFKHCLKELGIDRSFEVERLKDLRGFYKAKGVAEQLNIKPQVLADYKDRILKKARDKGIDVREKGCSGGNGTRYFFQGDLEYKELKERIPEKYHKYLSEWIGKGKSPRSFCAVVCYLESDKTQKECAEEFDVTPITLRNNRDYVLEVMKNE